MNITKTARIFLQFLYRDAYNYRERLLTYFINYCFIYPTIYTIGIGYIMATTYFGPNSAIQSTTLLVGHMLIVVFSFAYNLSIGLIFDLENKRFIDYQITLLDPRLVIVQRILFNTIFTCIIALPFFPMAKLILGTMFVTTHASWLATSVIIFLSALCSAAYTHLTACLMPSSRSLRSFWMRINFVLLLFGGTFIPWQIIKQFCPPLGYILLLNPFVYVTEGLRRAMLGTPNFMPVWICAGALTLFTVLFTIFTWHYFKKKVDHI
ncbi:MAG: ABC transporter permease [Candidatus Dependentiae bacterium]|nr:ABC transporter permease [Candidatus Dependentiae bacterium]